MITITISDTGVTQLPPSILHLLGLQKGGTASIQASENGVTLTKVPIYQELTQKQKRIDAKVNQGFGMVKIAPQTTPTPSLMDFDVADHIQLFDNMGE
ncbi:MULTISPECIES: hypothetical protein [unclassified Moraxella]|uniref:hypothetical protein n=1 Tax=unclassified Moraxella TaxID=2685852 RepID=UPI003AF6558D